MSFVTLLQAADVWNQANPDDVIDDNLDFIEWMYEEGVDMCNNPDICAVGLDATLIRKQAILTHGEQYVRSRK